MRPDDPYSRVDYRRLVAWPERIEREWPFLRRALGEGGRVVDLGCGTGVHSRFLASQGFDVIGIDSSPSMVAKATDAPLPPNLRFTQGDITSVAELVAGQVDAAICLGNTLPHIVEDAALARMAAGLRRCLRPGAPLVLQVLNYERILAAGTRFLPLNFRGDDAEGGEVVFLRLMTPVGGGRIVFTPTTLRYRPRGEPPVEVVASRNVMLRAWSRPEIERVLADAGFTAIESYGSMAGAPYHPAESTDAIIVAR